MFCILEYLNNNVFYPMDIPINTNKKSTHVMQVFFLFNFIMLIYTNLLSDLQKTLTEDFKYLIIYKQRRKSSSSSDDMMINVEEYCECEDRYNKRFKECKCKRTKYIRPVIRLGSDESFSELNDTKRREIEEHFIQLKKCKDEAKISNGLFCISENLQNTLEDSYYYTREKTLHNKTPKELLKIMEKTMGENNEPYLDNRTDAKLLKKIALIYEVADEQLKYIKNDISYPEGYNEADKLFVKAKLTKLVRNNIALKLYAIAMKKADIVYSFYKEYEKKKTNKYKATFSYNKSMKNYLLKEDHVLSETFKALKEENIAKIKNKTDELKKEKLLTIQRQMDVEGSTINPELKTESPEK